MKKIIITTICAITIISPALALEQTEENYEYPNKLKCMDILTSMYDERYTMYNVLNLNYEQEMTKREIDKAKHDELETILPELKDEKLKLHELVQNNAPHKEIVQQENRIQKINKQMKEVATKYDEKLFKILDREQRSKYKAVRKIAVDELEFCEAGKVNYEPNERIIHFVEKDTFPQLL
ncbi:MAG: hypothetical protein R3Y28_06395 [Candidatus Gastranaerophilales bacterium]